MLTLGASTRNAAGQRHDLHTTLPSPLNWQVSQGALDGGDDATAT